MTGLPDECRCSFCGKQREAVRRLVAAGEAAICDECIALSHEIIAERPRPAGAAPAGNPDAPSVHGGGARARRHVHGGLRCSFCGSPQQEVRTLVA